MAANEEGAEFVVPAAAAAARLEALPRERASERSQLGLSLIFACVVSVGRFGVCPMNARGGFVKSETADLAWVSEIEVPPQARRGGE